MGRFIWGWSIIPKYSMSLLSALWCAGSYECWKTLAKIEEQIFTVQNYFFRNTEQEVTKLWRRYLHQRSESPWWFLWVNAVSHCWWPVYLSLLSCAQQPEREGKNGCGRTTLPFISHHKLFLNFIWENINLPGVGCQWAPLGRGL